MRKQVGKRIFAVFLMLLLVVSSFPQISLANDERKDEKTFEDIVSKGSYNLHEDYLSLDVRFWEDEKPGVGFYINHANLYNLSVVNEPGFGTSHGEWTVMGLLRGMHGGYYYNEELTEDYFNGYIKQVEDYVTNKDGNLDRNKSTEWSRSILALSALGYDITNVAGYDYIEKLSESHSFSYRQGINGPIWEIIALNTGPYNLYEDDSNEDVNTIGKMIDYIVNDELEQADGSKGGWNLAAFISKNPDADITGMALQALAPYYLDKNLYDKTGAETPYNEFIKVVERGIYILSEMQLDNGGFAAFGNVNAESTVQAIVALTALNIDPISNVDLPNINKKANFITDGAIHDNVRTNNMIDKLLTFWAPGSAKANRELVTEEDKHMYRIAGGFKHVTSGDDGGGGSGTSVNGMATDQSIYGLIAYDRFKNGEKALYDMSDMVNGEYKQMMKATNQTISFEEDGSTSSEKGKRYGLIELPKGTNKDGKSFKEWNSKQDGSGTSYEAGEMLVVPEKDVTLYAQYDYEDYTIQYELNDGVFLTEDVVQTYTSKDEVILPSEADLVKNGFTFVGWFEDENLTGNKVDKIVSGSTGNKTFYAKWKEDINEEEIAGKEVDEIIAALPSSKEVLLQHKTEIEAARTAYESLTDKAKEYVTNISKLEALEERVAQLTIEKEIEDKKIELDAEITKALETELRMITNESAKKLGSAVGSAEYLLNFNGKISTSKEENQALFQKLSTSLDELNAAMDDIEYKDEENMEVDELYEEETVASEADEESEENTEVDEENIIENSSEQIVVSHLHFEVARLSAYELDQISAEKKEKIEQLLFEAQELLNAEQPSQEEVDAMVASLRHEIEIFEIEEPTDKTGLERAIEFAKNTDTTNKTEESVQALLDATAMGENVLNKTDASQEEIDEAINAIYLAVEQLKDEVEVNPINKETLVKSYDRASKIDVTNKTKETAEALQSALTKAKSVIDNDESTQEEVDNALKQLLEAIDQLEELVDKEALREAYKDAGNINLSNKTEASVNQFNKVLEEVNAVLENESATQEEVDNALELLQKAIGQLEDEESGGGNPGKPSKPSNPSNPSNPGNPGKPTNPSKPSETEKPGLNKPEIGSTPDEELKEDSSSLQTEVGESNQKNENALPNTATPMYSMMFIGGMLFLLGFAYLIFQRKVRKN